jgi:hypothetical protein
MIADSKDNHRISSGDIVRASYMHPLNGAPLQYEQLGSNFVVGDTGLREYSLPGPPPTALECQAYLKWLRKVCHTCQEHNALCYRTNTRCGVCVCAVSRSASVTLVTTRRPKRLQLIQTMSSTTTTMPHSDCICSCTFIGWRYQYPKSYHSVYVIQVVAERERERERARE